VVINFELPRVFENNSKYNLVDDLSKFYWQKISLFFLIYFICFWCFFHLFPENYWEIKYHPSKVSNIGVPFLIHFNLPAPFKKKKIETSMCNRFS